MLWLTTSQLRSKNPGSRRKAAEQLCRAPDPRAIRALRRALTDEDKEVRRLATLALGKLEDDRRLEPLLEALRDRDPEVLKAAILSLKRSTDERVTAALAPLVHHGNAGVRGHAAQVLQYLGWRPSRVEDELWFLVAKGEFGRTVSFGSAAVPALEAVLASSPSSFGVGAIEALGQINDGRVLPALIRALKSDDPAVCVAAVDALCGIGGAQVVAPLLSVLHHKNGQVRATVAQGLGRLRAPAAVEPLRSLLSDAVWEVRREAAEALGRLRDPQAVEGLAGILNDGDADVRETVALALGNMGDRRAIRALVLALKDQVTGVRRIAAAALSRIDPDWSSSPEARSAVEELKSALQDGDANVRHFVGQLLVGLGAVERAAAPAADPEETLASSPAKRRKLAVTLFSAVVCDVDRDLRQAAAEALGRLGDGRAQNILLRAKADADAGVRAAAEQALHALGCSIGSA